MRRVEIGQVQTVVMDKIYTFQLFEPIKLEEGVFPEKLAPLPAVLI